MCLREKGGREISQIQLKREGECGKDENRNIQNVGDKNERYKECRRSKREIRSEGKGRR